MPLLWRTGPVNCASGSHGRQPFCWCNIEPEGFTLHSYPSAHHRALVSWATEDPPVTNSRVQIQPFADPSSRVLANRVMKHFYKSRDAVILPGESKLRTLCIVVICRRCLRKHPWKSRGPERCNIAELKGAVARILLKQHPKSSAIPGRLEQLVRLFFLKDDRQIFRGLENTVCWESWKAQSSKNYQETRQQPSGTWKACCKKARDNPFSTSGAYRTRINGIKLRRGRFSLDTRKNFPVGWDSRELE